MTGITRSTFTTLLALSLVVGPILLASDESSAQERQKIRWTARPENTKFTFQHQLEIADVPGHAIRMFEVRRTWPTDPPTMEGLKVVEEVARGMSDLIAGNGRSSGYSLWRLENGDLTFSQFQTTAHAVVNPDRSRKATFTGTYVTTGGTGKLRGIKGFGRFSGLAEFNPEGKVTRNEYSAEGEYWIEK